MKIIYFSLDYSPHDHRFLSALSETGHDVFYVRLQRGPRQVEDRPVPEKVHQVIWAGGQDVFHWRDLFRLTFAFRRLVKKIKPDIVHAGPIQTCGLIATLAGAGPRLIMSWGFDLMDDIHKSRWMEKITKYVLHNAAYFASDAEVTRNEAVSCGMRPDRTIVFPWGVDLDTFTPDTDHWSTKRDQFTLFCNRSWEPRYGVDVLARAFVAVAEKHPETDLLLLGGGSQVQAIRNILTRGGVQEQVTFAGQIPNREMPRYYHMADLYISPSHVDGSSVSLMEALACGLPCLVSDIPANKEWVTDGVNGWLFPNGDDGALAAKILAAMDTRDTLARMSQAARRTAEEKADWNKNFQKLLETYQQIKKEEL